MEPGGKYDYIIYPGKAGTEYVQGPTYAFYRLDNYLPGQYGFYVEGADSTSLDETLTMQMVAKNNVTMAFELNGSAFHPGDQILLEAVLSEGGTVASGEHVSGGRPITDAIVNVEITIPGTVFPITISLNHTGNGIYSASLTTLQRPVPTISKQQQMG